MKTNYAEELWNKFGNTAYQTMTFDSFQLAIEEFKKAQREACAEVFANWGDDSENDGSLDDLYHAILNAEIQDEEN